MGTRQVKLNFWALKLISKHSYAPFSAVKSGRLRIKGHTMSAILEITTNSIHEFCHALTKPKITFNLDRLNFEEKKD
jgi:hypothetical protein